MENPADDYQKQQQKEKRVDSILSRIGIGHIILVALGAFIVIKVSNSKIDYRYNYVAYAAFIVIILYLIYKPNKTQEFIPRRVAADIAQRELDYMKKNGQFSFDSQVLVQPASATGYKTDLIEDFSGITSWNIGAIERMHGSDYVKEWVVKVHPYSGEVMAVIRKPFGFTGNEVENIKIIPKDVYNVQTTEKG